MPTRPDRSFHPTAFKREMASVSLGVIEEAEPKRGLEPHGASPWWRATLVEVFLSFVCGSLLLAGCKEAPSPSAEATTPTEPKTTQRPQVQSVSRTAEAISLAEEKLRAAKVEFGLEHTNVAQCLIELARLRLDQGEYAAAKPLAEQALSICEKALGTNHIETARVMNDLASVCEKLGELDQAEGFFLRAQEAYQSAVGDGQGDPDWANTLNNLAVFYRNKGDLAKAKSCGERSLRMRESIRTPSREVGQSLNVLGSIQRQAGEFVLAEATLQRALEVNRAVLPENHSTMCASYFQLAWLQSDMGQWTKGLKNIDQALRIGEQVFGTNHPTTAQILSVKGSIHSGLDQYFEAERAYQRALAIDLTTLSDKHPNTASVRNNLALVYKQIGDYDKALDLLLKSLAVEEATYGTNHATVATTSLNLAGVYEKLGRTSDAERCLLRAVQIREGADPQHPEVGQALNNVAVFYLAMDHPEKAKPLLERALAIFIGAFGEDNENVGVTLTSLAHVCERQGDLDQALGLCRRAIGIFERVLGASHSRTAMALKQLARMHIATGRKPDALTLADRVRQSDENLLKDMLSFSSERQRLMYQQQADPYWLPASLGLARELATVLLRNRGIVLDSLLEDRAQAALDKKGSEGDRLNRLQEIRERLAQLYFAVPSNATDRTEIAKEEASLRQEMEKIDGELARAFSNWGRTRRALSLTVDQVQARLPQEAVLVEFIRYNQPRQTNRWESRYGAVLLAHAGEPRWIALESAATVERQARLYGQLTYGTPDEASLTACLKELYRLVWAPLLSVLPTGANTVIICPDGDLNFVSLATLMAPDGQFLGQQFSLRYVATGRDLLGDEYRGPQRPKDLVILANPDFGAAATTALSTNPAAAVGPAMPLTGLGKVHFTPLLGAEQEAKQLSGKAKALGFKQVRQLLGKDATESELRRTQSPYVLHLGTHGFLDVARDGDELGRSGGGGVESSSTPAPESARHENAMFRSILAFAGAERTLDNLPKGLLSDPANDGILTAAEAAGLHLQNTWLVVLAACETGLGEARAGEGVFGLRRGFSQAGARNLLMTLWRIDDQRTVQLMLDFYAAALNSGNASRALAEVQREYLVKLRERQGLVAACKVAGAFILTFQGPP